MTADECFAVLTQKQIDLCLGLIKMNNSWQAHNMVYEAVCEGHKLNYKNRIRTINSCWTVVNRLTKSIELKNKLIGI